MWVQKTRKLVYERDIWNPITCTCENGKYLENGTDNTLVTCNDNIKSTKTVLTNFNKEETTCKISIFYSPFYSLPFWYG